VTAAQVRRVGVGHLGNLGNLAHVQGDLRAPRAALLATLPPYPLRNTRPPAVDPARGGKYPGRIAPELPRSPEAAVTTRTLPAVLLLGLAVASSLPAGRADAPKDAPKART
jgi:hypothetical protein